MSKLANTLLACAALMLGACASTSLQSAWFDTTYQGGAFKRILVVGVGSNVANRRVFEDIFAQKLSATGTQGVPGYRFLADDARVNESDWNAGVAQSGAACPRPGDHRYDFQRQNYFRRQRRSGA